MTRARRRTPTDRVSRWAACRGAMAIDAHASCAGECAPVPAARLRVVGAFVRCLPAPYAVLRISVQRPSASPSGAVAYCVGMWSSGALLRNVGQWPAESAASAARAVTHCVEMWSRAVLRRDLEQWRSAPRCGAKGCCSRMWSRGVLLQDVEQRGVAPGCGARHRAAKRHPPQRFRPSAGGRR